MLKITAYVLGAIIVLGGGFLLFNNYIYTEKQGDTGFQPSYKDIAYAIDGKEVLLTDGYSEVEAAPGSASKVITKYFGNEAEGDLNGDGISDIAFLLTQEGGGSGTFYYAVAAIKTDTGYEGVDAVLLGDRIAPQTTEIKNGQLIVNYADRAPGEDFSVRPSFGKSLYLKLDPTSFQFGEVVQNFEGEADPSRMTLGMKAWVWMNALYNNDTTVTPAKEGVFTLTFEDDGMFSATTDCNQMSGSYTVDGQKLSFGPILMTKKFCAGSQEGVFAELLTNTAEYHFTSKGELILGLKFDSGTVVFK